MNPGNYSFRSEKSLLRGTKKAGGRSFSFDLDAIVKSQASSSKRGYVFLFFLIISTVCSASFGALMLSLPSTPLMKLLWRNLFSAAFLLPFTLLNSPFREFFKKKVFLSKMKRYFVGAFWFTATSISFIYSIHYAGLGATCIIANFDVIWIILFKSFKRELGIWKKIWIGLLLCTGGVALCFYYSQSYWLLMGLVSSFASTIFISWSESIREKQYWIGYFCLFFISSGYLFGIIFLSQGLFAIFDSNHGFFSIFRENTLVNVLIVAALTSIGSTGLMFSISRRITPSLHSISILAEPTIALCLGSLLGYQDFIAINLWIAIILSLIAYVQIKNEELKAEDEAAELLFYEMDTRDEPEQETSASFLWMRRSISYNI